jgi:uncharacterized membrane protein YjfL (UPF0719 family)
MNGPIGGFACAQLAGFVVAVVVTVVVVACHKVVSPYFEWSAAKDKRLA